MQKNKIFTKETVMITVKLFSICVVVALLLAGVNALTVDTIAENALKEQADAIRAIFPACEDYDEVNTQTEGVTSAFLVRAGGKEIGFAAGVEPMGFGGKLSMIVGLDLSGKIVGVKIVSHSETPGLGGRVNDEGYLSQYIGKSGELTIGENVDAITGSSISSKAVLAGVNSAVKAFAELSGGDQGGAQ